MPEIWDNCVMSCGIMYVAKRRNGRPMRDVWKGAWLGMARTKRNSFHGFSVKRVRSWMGSEGVFTSCTLMFGSKVLGECLLSGDGGADLYRFPAMGLNSAIVRQVPALPDWCQGGYEPAALSYVVATLADWWEGGVRGHDEGVPINCEAEVADILAYQDELSHALAM